MSSAARDRPESSARTGRRPGSADTRGVILAAARGCFAESGYEGATMRAIGRAARVDPALIVHYFGTKRDLFATAMRPPVEPGPVVRAALAADPAQAGRRLAELAITSWEREEIRAVLVGVLRAAGSDAVGAELIRGLVEAQIIDPLAAALGGGHDARLRATLASAQISGLAMVRYVYRLEPLASAEPSTLVDWLAPTLQRYLVGSL